MISSDNWRQWLWQQLRELKPGDTLVAGEMFERVRLHLPLHLSMRQAQRNVKQFEHQREIDADQAAWLYFTHAVQQMQIGRIAAAEHGNGRRNTWKYQDRLYLKPVEGKVCDKCGGGMIKVRGRRAGALVLKNPDAYLECQVRCWEVVEIPQARQYRGEVVLNPELLKPPVPVPIFHMPPTLLPMMPPMKQMIIIPRREMVKMIRSLMTVHMQATTSINSMVRELVAAKDNHFQLLARYGVPLDKWRKLEAACLAQYMADQEEEQRRSGSH